MQEATCLSRGVAVFNPPYFKIFGWLGVILSMSVGNAATAQDVAAARLHAEAVSQARAKDYVGALAKLEDLMRRYPLYPAFHNDYITVLNWSGNDERVLTASVNTDISISPVYVVEAIAKSARNRGDLERSAALYLSIIQREPQYFEAALGLVRVMTEQGRLDPALEAAQRLVTEWPKEISAWLARANVANAKQDWVGMLDSYMSALSLVPTYQEAQRGRVLALARLGASHLALYYAESTPTLFSPHEFDMLRHEQAVVMLRWSRVNRQDGNGSAQLDAAISGLSALVKELAQRGEKATPRFQQVCHDLVVALSERRRDAEALTLFESMSQPVNEIPNYTRVAAAASAARLGQTERAIALYRELLVQKPEDTEATEGLIYALLDNERHAEAEAMARAWSARESVLSKLGHAAPQENHRKVRADRLIAKAQSYANHLAAAQGQLLPLVNSAPQHAGLRVDLGNIYLWRGWPRRAQAEFQTVLASNPHDIDAQRGLIHAWLDQNDYQTATTTWRAAEPALADSAAMGRHIARRQRASAEWSVASNDNGAVARGMNELNMDARFTSRVYAGGWRGTAAYHSAEADLSSGHGRMQRVSGGVLHTSPEWDLAADLSSDATAFVSDSGVAARALWHPNDVWRLGVGGESYLQDLPLQAYVRDIDASRVFGDIGYRVNESRSYGLHAERVSFSDDNQRTAMSAYWSQRIWSSAQRNWDGGLDAYTSRNTRDDAPYFNPRSDRSFNASLGFEQQLWRRGDAAWKHRLSSSVGNYWQENYGDAATWQLRYQHTWRPLEALRLALSVKRSKPVYDGNDEYYTEWAVSGAMEFGS